MPLTAVTTPPETRIGPAPSAGRLIAVSAGVLGVCGGLTWAAAALVELGGSPWGWAGSVACGVTAMLVLGSLVEWLVHRFLMHRRWPLRIAYELHHRAHHWIHYRPDAYLKDEVTYVPAVPPRPERLCTTRMERVTAAVGQAAFYACFAAPILASGWFLSGNAPFVIALGGTAAAIIFLAVHVHDSVHCPGHSPLERFGWFWFLDRHHYVHHVDNQANTNFLLPLGDLLLGTLRRELTARELSRWPTYEDARRPPGAR